MMMKNLVKLILIAVLGAVALKLAAQGIEFTAAAKNNVQVGEQFRAVYSVNQQVDNFTGPDFEGFRILSGPNQSSNQSYQFINGKVSQSFQLTFTYYLQATKEGTFDIGPAKVLADDKTYQSNALQISVSQGAAAPSGNTQQQGNARQSQQKQQNGIAKDDIFIRAVADKNDPYQGEQVIITYKIYTTVPISQINVSKLSSFPGFFYKNLLDDNQPLKQYNEVVNGKQYVVADIRKIALFAQRSGNITIEPMELNCLAQVKVDNASSRDPFFDSFFNDPFFNRSYQNVELNLSSNAVTLGVKQLPAADRPADFGGAVGSFTISSNIDRTRLKSNEPLTLKVTLSGKGNIELIDALPLSFPPDFETYDPKISNNLNRSASGISGTRTFEYLVIPRNAGEFQIKPVLFSYFDPGKPRYSTLSTPLFTITVDKGEEAEGGVTYSGVSQKDIQFIGSDIRYIKTGQIQLQRVNSLYFGSSSFFIWMIIPVLIFASAIAYWSYNKKRTGDVALVRNRKANKVARKNLTKAGEFLKSNQTEAFFEEISRALWGYISNKFNIPLSDLSIETVHQRLATKGVGDELIGQFTKVLESCEYSRFAPGDKSGKMHEIYNEALAVISKIEQELK
jgi:hypothetical protein